MNKGQGSLLAIKFTQEITNLDITPVEGYTETKYTNGLLTSNTYNSVMYPISSMLDDNISTAWRTYVKGCYIQLTCIIPQIIHVRWY